MSAPNITSRPLTSHEYLKKLREKRQSSHESQNFQQPPTVELATEAVVQPSVAKLATEAVVQPLTVDKSTINSATKPIVSATNSQSKEKSSDSLFPNIAKPRPKKVIMKWQAASRPFKKRDKHYYLTVAAIVFLISLILFFVGQFLPIAVVVAVGFLAYVLSSVPPHLIEIEISTYGIEIDHQQYYFEEMGKFWFDKKLDQNILLIEIARFPGRLTLLFNPSDQTEIKTLLSEVLLEEKPPDTIYDKGAKWLQEKIPLEVK